MNRQNLNHVFMLLAACSMLFTQLVHAAPHDEAMQRAQFMIRQVSAERDQLQTGKASLQKQFDELQKKYNELENRSSKVSGDMKKQFSELRDMYENERKEHEATRASLASLIVEKNQLTDVATNQTQSLELCIGNNKKIFDITSSLLTAYEDKSVWDSLMQAEPVTGMSKVKIENLVDDMQYKLDGLRLNVDRISVNKLN